MEVGDSFYVPMQQGQGTKPLEAGRKAVQRQAKALPGTRRFAWRREHQGWRCWRVE
jgi:hypothetical protein